MADLPPYPGAPRWVKVFAIVAVIVIVLFVILLLTKGPGGHGSGHHGLSGGAGRDAPSSRVTTALTPLADHTPSGCACG